MENVSNVNQLIQNIEKNLNELNQEVETNTLNCILFKNDEVENMNKLIQKFNDLCLVINENKIVEAGYKRCNMCNCLVKDFKRHLFSNKHADNAYTKYRVMNNEP